MKSKEQLLDLIDNDLSTMELEAILAAHEANLYAFRLKIKAWYILAERRKKYSGDPQGDDKKDPYTNFKIVHGIMKYIIPGLTMEQVILFYVAIKIARLMITINKDFADESVIDTVIDLSNYSDILGGWVLRKSGGVITEFDLESEEDYESG